MSHPVDNAFARILEILVLALTVGCSVWISVIAANMPRVLAST